MTNTYGVNLTDSMIAEIDAMPKPLVTLSYRASEKIKALLLFIILPIVFAAVLIHGPELFLAKLSVNIQQVFAIGAGLGFMFILYGYFKAKKYFSPKYSFTDSGFAVEGKTIEWWQVDHVEVLSEPRVKDKASIIIYLEQDQQLGLKIKKHEMRMKVSEVIRRHVENIAFKD